VYQTPARVLIEEHIRRTSSFSNAFMMPSNSPMDRDVFDETVVVGVVGLVVKPWLVVAMKQTSSIAESNRTEV